ncbi:DUF1134 domain-containing protein [Microvirga sp. 2MCAF38]|uniref:DUF1134 domain-containing protein n=1 Tax=Microvirga sp. 2MCAF38 TaxID=3232989 RepID=UPI003F9488BE
MRSRKKFLLAASIAAALYTLPLSAQAQGVQRAYASNPGAPGSYNSNELVESGHQFFGSASRGLALAVQEAVSRWGEPNGYILGQEASGAFFGGLRYGEGKLFSRNAGERRIFWQGPSLGFDVGGDGARTMMLVYNLQHMDAIYRRFVGINGSAYLIGGFGVSAAKADDMVVVPIKTGVGARLGVNMGYLKFTPDPTWNPF